MCLYLKGLDVEGDLADMTKDDIIKAGRPILFGKSDRRTCKHLLETVSLLNPSDQAWIHMAAAQKQKQVSQGRVSGVKQQKTAEDKCMADDMEDESRGQYDDSKFLRAPDRSVIARCISKFIDHTGNSAVTTAVCMACARLMSRGETQVVAVAAIPNGYMLAPSTPHPAHRLTQNMLLQRSAIHMVDAHEEGVFVFFTEYKK